MKNRILVFILCLFSYSQTINAQCPGALECNGSQVFCMVAQLNGFMCSNPDFPNTGFPLPTLCFGVGVPHNINWWSFVGAGGPLVLTFNFDPANCTMGQGIQAGVFEGNCDGTTVWACDGGCNTSTFTFSGQTTECEIYYVWVDGCNGDVCDYTITITGNTGSPQLPRPLPVPVANDPICVCGTTEFCWTPIGSCEPVTEWTANGVPVGIQGDECVEIEFPDGSPIQVCVTVTIGNPLDPNAICDQDMVCRTFTPDPIMTAMGPLRTLCPKVDPFIWHGMPITMSCINPPCSARVESVTGCCVDSLVPFQILPPEVKIGLPRTICPENQPFEWHGTPLVTSCINPPCTASIEGPDGCLIDSVVSFNLLPPRRVGMVDTFFCQLPPTGYRTEDNQVWNEDVCGEEITFKDPIFMCDTTYMLNLRVFKYSVDWQSDCGPCDGGVTVCPNIEYDPECAEFNDGTVQITLNWKDATGQDLGITPGTGCMLITKPGLVCVDLTVMRGGVSCPGPWRECFDIPAEFFPAAPIIEGDSSVCGSVPGQYMIDEPDGACQYFWEIRAGAGVIITPNALDTNAIEVDWTNAVGNFGLVCVYYKADCGVSEDTCFMVDFAGTPQINAGPDTNICASSYTMNGIQDIGGAWTQVAGPGTAMIQDVSDPNSLVDILEYGEYKFIWTESENGCTSIDTVTVGFRPDPTIQNIDTLCTGDADGFVIMFELATGTAPYTIVSGGGSIDVNNVYTSDTIADNTPTTIVIRDTFGCETSYFVDHDCVCQNAVGTIANDTLAFCGPNEQVCADYNPVGQSLVPGVDTLMFVLYTTPGQLQATEIARNNDGCFNFDPATMNLDQVYYIGAAVGMKDANGTVDLDGGCLQLEEAQAVIWYTIPDPEAGIDETICGEVYNLSGSSSFPGSSFRWLNTSGVILDDPNQLNTNATIQVGQHGVYEFILEETNAICTSYDTVSIQFFEIPEPDNARELCVDSISRVSFDYVVCFDITKGQPPYTIISGGGTIDPVTNGYCSDQLMSLQTYTIVIEDANGCQFTISGDHNCDCGPTDPGTMDQTTLETCVDQCVTIETNNTETVQNDEVAEFVLHEGSGSVIINEIVRYPYDPSANPKDMIEFCFDATAGMIPGRVYYISRVIHEMNVPDDPCERIAQGQPVIWNNYPQSDAGSDQDVCGLVATLGALPSIGTGAWTVVGQPSGSNYMLGSALPTSMVTVDQYGTYTFQWTEDNVGCKDSDTVNITFHDAPRISNVFIECDDNAENYRIWIELADGDPSTYTVTGVPIADQRGNTFTTDWLPSGSTASFCATDIWDCQPACQDTTHICDCISEIGTVTGDDIKCIDDCVTAFHQGGNTDNNDIIRFVIHDGDANNLGAIISCNGNGQFCFDPATMQPNTQYYITALVGNNDGSNCVDLTDRCLGVSTGIPITWYEYPVPDIASSGNIFTCQVDSLQLDGTGSTAPGAADYNWTTLDGAFCSPVTNTPSVWICSAGTYILTVTHQESGCATSDTIVIDRDQNLPNVTAGPSLELTCDQTSVTLDATGSDFGGDFTLEWLDPTSTVIANTLMTTVSTPGIYTVRVINSQTDCEDMKTVEVTQNIDPPTAVIDQIGQLSCTTDMAELNASGTITQGGVRSYTWSTTNGQIDGSTNGSSVQISEPGDYTLIVVDERNGCSDTIVLNVMEIGNTLAALDATPMDPSCFGFNDGSIDINISGGVGTLEYSINGGAFTTSSVVTNLSPGTYDIVVRDGNGCEKDTTVVLNEPAQITITTKDDLIKEAGSSVGLDTLIAQITGINPADADSIYWYDIETGKRVPQTTIDSLRETRTYRVVIYKGPCQSSDLITIFVKYTRNVFVPNVIYPGSESGDPDNQILTVHSNQNRIDLVKFMRVYDRWGELIYSRDDITYDERIGRTTEGWDGTFNGEVMNPGVYIYHIQVAFFGSDGEQIIQDFFGDVTLIR